jgi:hypothetical protein
VDRNSLFSQKEFELFFRGVDDRIIARESVIGGEDSLAAVLDTEPDNDGSLGFSILSDKSEYRKPLSNNQFADNHALFY